ncbi:MAG TPA: hypothetical protein VF678_08745 [bacterium]
MKVQTWLLASLMLVLGTGVVWAQPMAPVLAVPGTAAAQEGADLAAKADKLMKEGGDAKAKEAMGYAERGAELGDPKALILVAFIYWKTGTKPEDFGPYIRHVLAMTDVLPVDDPLVAHSFLMRGLVKNGDIPAAEDILNPAVQRGSPAGMFHLGMLRFVAGDNERSKLLLTRASAAGYLRATTMLNKLGTAAEQRAEELEAQNKGGVKK